MLNESKKNMMNCDQVFAFYLRELALGLNSIYYSHKLLKFILFFRDCLNQYGWHKKSENDVKEHQAHQDYEYLLREKLASYDSVRSVNEFTAICNAEFAPEIANEFVTVFFDDHISGQLSRSEVIDLTQHLCHWLF